MDQNINLLASLPTPPPSIMPANLIAQMTAAWIIALIVIYSITWAITNHKQKEVFRLEAMQKSLQTSIESTNKNISALQGKGFVTISENAANLPVSRSNPLGFFRYFEDLAEFTPSGIWITDFIFSQIDDTIAIRGNTLAASGVPAFINALARSDDLRQKKFSTLQLKKTPNSNSVNFILSTTTTEIEQNKAAGGDGPAKLFLSVSPSGKANEDVDLDAELEKIR